MIIIKKQRIFLFSLILLFTMGPMSAAAAGFGARALGMGGAYTAIADEGTAAYWNPAGITQSDLGVIINGGLEGDPKLFNAIKKGDAATLDGTFGLQDGVGLSFKKWAFNYERDLRARGLGLGGEMMLVEQTREGILTYATECTDFFAFGVNAKYIYVEEETIDRGRRMRRIGGSGFAVDLGAMFKVGKLVRVGAVLKDYTLSEVQLDGGVYSLPTKAVLGGAVKVPLLGMVVAADIETPLTDRGDSLFRVGLEQPFLGILFLRAGGYQVAEDFNFTAGGGLKLGPVTVDVAADFRTQNPIIYASAGLKF
jgi:hypothetical protein